MLGLSHSATRTQALAPVLNWVPPTAASPQPSTWVKLHTPPTAFSFDEAWLMCECEGDRWLAWVPDYGEILLSADEFSNLDSL